jgi:hypothetical protein
MRLWGYASRAVDGSQDRRVDPLQKVAKERIALGRRAYPGEEP